MELASLNNSAIKLTPEQLSSLVSAIYKAGLTVTPGDMVIRTGFSAQSVELTLRNLAYDSGARILVNATGHVAYEFNRGFEKNQKNLLARLLRALWAGWTKTLAFTTRAGFGLALVLSGWTFGLPLFLIALTSAVCHLRKKTADELSLLDLRTWSRAIKAAFCTEIVHAGKRIPSNIFIDCYSFVFGDGDPNLDIEERRWSKIAQLISRNDGVITCEQLGPYVDRQPREDDVIPVLVRFNGTPEVTLSGSIAYVFPHLTVSSEEPTDRASPQLVASQPDFIENRYWTLTGISDSSLSMILILGAFNSSFVGFVLLCTSHLNQVYSWFLAPIIFFLEQHLGWVIHCCVALFHLFGIVGILLGSLAVAVLVPCAFLLSVFFLCFPPLRLLLIQFKNLVLWQRNSGRRKRALALQEPSPEFSVKLQEARQLAPERIMVHEGNLAFDSAKDSLSQQLDAL